MKHSNTIKRQATSRDLMTRVEVVFEHPLHEYTLRLYRGDFTPCLLVEHLEKTDCNYKFEEVVRFLSEIEGIKTIEVR